MVDSMDSGKTKAQNQQSQRRTTTLRNTWQNNGDIIGAFLDIQAAFNTILPISIKEALLRHNWDEKLVVLHLHFPQAHDNRT